MKDSTELMIEHGSKRGDVGTETKEVDIAMKEEVQFAPEDSYISSGDMPLNDVEGGSEVEKGIDTEENFETSETDDAKGATNGVASAPNTQIGDYPLPTQEVGTMAPPEPPETELDGDDLKENNAAESKESGLGEIDLLGE